MEFQQISIDHQNQKISDCMQNRFNNEVLLEYDHQRKVIK